MSNVFVEKAKQEFLEYSTMWIDFMCEKFPNCPETGDCKIFLDSVVMNSPEQLAEQIDLWHQNVTNPLNVKKTKYAKAVERIIGSPACVYHAMMYKDITALRENMKSPMAERVDLLGKYESLSEHDQIAIWKFMQKISNAAFEAKSASVPRIPTREEISENIKMRKDKATDDTPSMLRAFQTHINGLCKHLQIKPVLDGVDDAQVKDWMSRWGQFCKESTNDVQHTILCQQKSPAVLACLHAKFPELTHLNDKCDDENVWKNINQLNGFAAVTENIPIKMMGRIEDMASRLADDIVSGRTDMASVNLKDIGQQVLAGCDEADMSKFAGNIEQLLPALQTFSQRPPPS